jgi:hypothetical protein
MPLFKPTPEQRYAVLCDPCQSLFYGDLVTETCHLRRYQGVRPTDRDSNNTRQFEWHESFASLELAAKNGCHLCVQACGALTKKQLALLGPGIPAKETAGLSPLHHIEVTMELGGYVIEELFLGKKPSSDLSLHFKFTSSTLQQETPAWEFKLTCVLKPEMGKQT